MSGRALVAVVAALLLASCFSRGAVHSYRTEGGPPIADPGPGEAYRVWHDRAGWHLRARSATAQRFEGRVESLFMNRVQPVGIAKEALRPGFGALAFSFVGDPAAGEAGFDWQGGCADFSLYIDGAARPLRVFAGAYGASPPRVPFSLCPW